MSQIEAIYRHGVFEPLEPVNLQEEQRVRLSIEPAEKESFEAWIKRVDELREQIFKRQVFSPIARRGLLRIGCDEQCRRG